MIQVLATHTPVGPLPCACMRSHSIHFETLLWQVCVAKASYEKTLAVSSDHLLAEAAATVAVKAKEIGLKSKAAPGTPVAATRDSRATVVVLTAANVTAQVFADAGIEVGKGDSGRKGRSSKEQQSDDKAEAEAEAEDGGRRRALLQLPGNDVGACEWRRVHMCLIGWQIAARACAFEDPHLCLTRRHSARHSRVTHM